MDILKELVAIIDQNKVKNIEIIGNPAPKKTLTKILYQKVAKEKSLTDRKAAKSLYNSNENDKKYRSLKNRLVDRLINTLFFIDVKKARYNDLSTAQTNCWKNIVAAKLLYDQAAYKSMVFILEKTLRIGMKLALTEITMETSKMLMEYYGVERRDANKFYYYNELFNRELKRYCAAAMATNFLGQVQVEKETKEEKNRQAVDFLKQLAAIPSDLKNFKFYGAFAAIQIYRYDDLNSPEELIRLLQSWGISSENRPRLFLKLIVKQYRTLLRIAAFEAAMQLENQIEAVIPIGSFTWFWYNYEKIKSLLTQDKTQSAYDLFRLLVTNIRFQFLSAQDKEYYFILEGYFSFLSKIKQISAPRFQEKPFRMGWLINSVPHSIRDKKGRNIQVLVLSWLHLLADKKFGAIVDKMDGTRQYAYRYLKEPENYRSFCFIKHLLVIPFGGFDKDRILQQLSDKVRRAGMSGLESIPQHNSLEIVPYERLWEFVLEALQ